jgi:hypothetical protein
MLGGSRVVNQTFGPLFDIDADRNALLDGPIAWATPLTKTPPTLSGDDLQPLA